MKTKRYYGMLLMLTFVCTAFLACGGDDDNDSSVINPDNHASIAVTGGVTSLTSFSATLTGSVNIEMADWMGFEYGKDKKLSSGIYRDTISNGQISAVLKDLLPNVTYYYRTRVKINDNQYFGEIKSFTTKNVVLQESGAVDLGLSVKWAACNLGARTPDAYGNYIEWGETTEKESMTYGFNAYKSDLGDEISGTQYDAAHVQLGGSWRMPTEEELQELRDKCMHNNYNYNGSEGLVFTGPNGNCIFLPSAGRKIVDRDASSMDEVGEYGYYWSGSIGSSKTSARALYFNTYTEDVFGEQVKQHWLSVEDQARTRYCQSIRPVTEQ